MLGKRKNRSKASKDSLPSPDEKKKEIERRSYGDKELVMDQARKHLKDTEFHVYDDIPKLLYDSRKGQMKKSQKARGKGFTAYFTNFSNCSIPHQVAWYQEDLITRLQLERPKDLVVFSKSRDLSCDYFFLKSYITWKHGDGIKKKRFYIFWFTKKYF